MKDRACFLLQQRLLATIRQQKLCTCGDTLILGVSGGADSVALLDLLASLDVLKLHLVVAHLNHCLRGYESDGDEQFTASLARSYGLEFKTCRVDIKALMAETGSSLEETARNARYNFFEKLRLEYNAAAIATAHHSDDQAETFLLRLLRGAGSSGLGCIPFKDNRSVIRPLLDISRHEIIEYLHKRKLRWREDSTNSDTELLRNKIRHELLPLLETYNRSIRKQLNITAAQMRQNEEMLTDYTEDIFKNLVQQKCDTLFYSFPSCNKLTEGLRLRLYRKGLALLVGNLRGFEYKHIRQIDQLLLSGSTGKQILLPQKTIAVRTSAGMLLSMQETLQIKPPQSIKIKKPGSYDLGNGLNLIISLAEAPFRLPVNADEAMIDLEKAPFPWLLRPYNKDDRLPLPGGQGSRAINRIMIDRKIPAQFRALFPLLLADNQPLWLAGLQRTNFAKISCNSGKVAYIVIKGEALAFKNV